MTAYINKIKSKAGDQQLPVTHERAVRDSNGTTLESKLQNLEGAMDKAYVASSDNGMGRITLKKNMVSGVNTLTQSMMQATNTIYVIQYDFTLGENITVPENCVLKFDGGSLSNGTVILHNNIAIYKGDFKNIYFRIFGSNILIQDSKIIAGNTDGYYCIRAVANGQDLQNITIDNCYIEDTREYAGDPTKLQTLISFDTYPLSAGENYGYTINNVLISNCIIKYVFVGICAMTRNYDKSLDNISIINNRVLFIGSENGNDTMALSLEAMCNHVNVVGNYIEGVESCIEVLCGNINIENNHLVNVSTFQSNHKESNIIWGTSFIKTLGTLNIVGNILEFKNERPADYTYFANGIKLGIARPEINIERNLFKNCGVRIDPTYNEASIYSGEVHVNFVENNITHNNTPVYFKLYGEMRVDSFRNTLKKTAGLSTMIAYDVSDSNAKLIEGNHVSDVLINTNNFTFTSSANIYPTDTNKVSLNIQDCHVFWNGDFIPYTEIFRRVPSADNGLKGGYSFFDYTNNKLVIWDSIVKRWVDDKGRYGFIPDIGTTNPDITNLTRTKDYGYTFFNYSLGMPLFYRSSNWYNAEGIFMTGVTSVIGSTTTREALNLSSLHEGLKYYDTTLKKYVLWNGTAWTNLDGSALS